MYLPQFRDPVFPCWTFLFLDQVCLLISLWYVSVERDIQVIDMYTLPADHIRLLTPHLFFYTISQFLLLKFAFLQLISNEWQLALWKEKETNCKKSFLAYLLIPAAWLPALHISKRNFLGRSATMAIIFTSIPHNKILFKKKWMALTETATYIFFAKVLFQSFDGLH